MDAQELGPIVLARRKALGLSQLRLAHLAGLSRATIHQLENSSRVDLGAAKLLALMQLLGIGLDAWPIPRNPNALAMLSQTASASYRHAMSPEELASALMQGTLPEAITPHLTTLLDEAPLSLILASVEQVAHRSRTPPQTL